MPTCQFCTFLLDGRLFGTPVPRVQEVMPYQQLTRVPLAPEAVIGMMNLRGQIVSAIDLRRRLGLPDRTPGQLPVNVVVQTNDGPVSLLVDEIGDVIEVAEDSVESAPATLQGIAREVVQGVCKLPDCLMLTLNVDRLVELGKSTKAGVEELG